MRNYEIMFIVNPNATEEEIDKINAQVEGVDHVGRRAGSQKIEKMGKRRLAYEVDKYREGHYVLFAIGANGDIVKEVRTPAPRDGCGDQVHHRAYATRKCADSRKCAVIRQKRAARRGSARGSCLLL